MSTKKAISGIKPKSSARTEKTISAYDLAQAKETISDRLAQPTKSRLSKATEETLKTLEKISGRKLTIGSMLWSIRECDEISQTAFAKMLGISRQYLCDVEHDRKSISAKMAAQFADILGYSKSQFVRLAFQAELNRYNLHLQVEIHEDPRRAA